MTTSADINAMLRILPIDSKHRLLAMCRPMPPSPVDPFVESANQWGRLARTVTRQPVASPQLLYAQYLEG